MVASIRPFLMFQGDAAAAIEFYQSVFDGAEVLQLERYATGPPGPEGGVRRAELVIAGQALSLLWCGFALFWEWSVAGVSMRLPPHAGAPS
ncbi:MAG TPA: VOC family protein [Caulobacteraceae bacterium]